MPKHHNSFDFLRLIFALLVIITHSVVLTGGGDADFLHRATGGQINCSYLGVRGFFVISGFLIFKSMQRSAGIGDYGKKRALRIFPALIVMLLVVAFIAGPLLSDLTASEYFKGGAAMRYVAAALRLPGIPKTATLPGVFAHNAVKGVVNGSLWTIWFELLFYIALLGFYPLRRRENILKWLLPGVWVLLYSLFLFGHAFLNTHIFPLTGMSAEVAVDLALYFLGGSVLTLISWEYSKVRFLFLTLGCVIVAAGLGTGFFHELRYIGLPLAIIAAGHGFVLLFSQIRRLGEPSYGIYIYAYPVQQAVIQLGIISPLAITLVTVPVVLLLGFASWHFVEAPLLSLKNKQK